MRVLYYNWAPLNYKRSIGGGVAVYIKNILSFLAHNKEQFPFEAVFLSSGFYYDFTKKPYIRKEESAHGFDVYTIVNSSILAPQLFTKNMYKKILTDKESAKVFEEFILQTGPYDVIHFHSLEGLSPNVLDLKAKFPNTKFLHTIHDYGIFCPTVQFWTSNQTNCVKDTNKVNCSDCVIARKAMPHRLKKGMRPGRHNRSNRIIIKLLNKIYTKLFYRLKLYSIFGYHDEATYKQFRNLCIEKINKNIDVELVVSNRVGEIAKLYGIDASKIKTAYIGTLVAEHCKKLNIKESGIFTLLYMGYMTHAKGFFSLLEYLENFDENISKHIDVKLAVKITDKSVYNRVLNLKSKFHDIICYEGYSHADFPKIMKDVSLGIIPSLWEDNLPQTAIEMIASGIPVLASENGGAHELNTHPLFTYHDKDDFKKKVETIYSDPKILDTYWDYSTPLTTMKKHMSGLIDLYTSPEISSAQSL